MSDYSELNRLVAQGSLPPIVATLIAENERVKTRLCVCRDCAGKGEVYSGHDSYQGYNQPPEPDMDVCGACGGDGVLGPLEDFESLAVERDHLKAENEALRRQAETAQRGTGQLVVENEALRKSLADIREAIEREYWSEYAGLEETRAILDAAMGKGEQS